MCIRHHNARRICRLLPQILSGNHRGQFGRAANLSAASLVRLLDSERTFINKLLDRGHQSRWHSTTPQVSPVLQSSPAQAGLLSFIQYAIHEFQGPSHYWLNRDEGTKHYFKKDATFLVLVGPILDSTRIGCDRNVVFEKLKFLQQRFPQVCFLGFHSGGQAHLPADKCEVVKLAMNEYLTFPILVSDKELFETDSGVCYVIFKDFKNPVTCHEEGQGLGDLTKAIEDFIVQNQKPSSVNLFSSTWSKQAEAIKELHFSSPLRDLLLYFPGCISADENGDRIFLSDSNHHRIIIFDSCGKILDTIGCCPGFEDGEFESAKLLRPAGSFFDATEDCLYIVDSENHAIRRANMESRILETVCPPCSKGESTGLWTWILDKLGIKKEAAAQSDVGTKCHTFDPNSVVFPWHIMKLDDSSFIIVNRSFEKLWIMDVASGEIKEAIEGLPKILEICGHLIMEKTALMEQMPPDWLKQQTESIYSQDELPCAALMSSLTTFENDIIMSDIVGQRVLKLNRDSGVVSNIQFSNLGILGLPYWLSHPLERVYCTASGLQGSRIDHIQSFRLLPGRIDIQLCVEIPACTELVEPLHDNCLWRQARGAAIEVSSVKDAEESTEEVGVAQKWYDELDNLAFEPNEPEMSDKDADIDEALSEAKVDGNVLINCAVNTSPGTSEVIIYAVLYLRLQRDLNLRENNQERYAEKIADILKSEEKRGIDRDSFVKFLVTGKSDPRDLIFMKPLHVKIKIDSLDHPKGENTKSVVLTDTTVEVNVAL